MNGEIYGEHTTVPELVNTLTSANTPEGWPVRLNRTIDKATGVTIAPGAIPSSASGVARRRLSGLSADTTPPWLHGVTVIRCHRVIESVFSPSDHDSLAQNGKEEDAKLLKSEDGVYRDGTFFIAETRPDSREHPG